MDHVFFETFHSCTRNVNYSNSAMSPPRDKTTKKNWIETNGNTKHTLILGQEESKEKEGAENLLRSVYWDLCKMSSI